ncbi:MAG: hypothetical protein Q4F54_03990 [Coriobacteriia bacterium]|nr:hypothetical protein [Coriobacteriia bacterium]
MEFSGKIFNYVVDESEIEGAQDRDGIEVTLSTSDAKVGIYKYGDPTNRAYCNVTGEGANNYNIIPKIVLSIEKRHLTVTPASKEFTYSGVEQKLSNDEVEFDNLADNHSITINE